jgi:hypothetical protein
MPVAATALIVVFVVVSAAAACAFLVLAWNLVRIPFNLKPGAAYQLGNPLNAVLKPEVLSESGLVARRRAGLALVVFISLLIAAAVSGLMAKLVAL